MREFFFLCFEAAVKMLPKKRQFFWLKTLIPGQHYLFVKIIRIIVIIQNIFGHFFAFVTSQFELLEVN